MARETERDTGFQFQRNFMTNAKPEAGENEPFVRMAACVWFQFMNMATPDSGNSNLPKEQGNEVCDIINCFAIKGARGNVFLRKENFRAQVSRNFHVLSAML